MPARDPARREQILAAIAAARGNAAAAAKKLGLTRAYVSKLWKEEREQLTKTPPQLGRPPGSGTVEIDEKKVDRLRAKGWTEEEIAEELVVSSRTLRRRCPKPH